MKFNWVIPLAILATLSCSHPPHLRPSNFEELKLEKLGQLQRSILKVTCSASYQHYRYSRPSDPMNTSSQENLLISKGITVNSVAGTGVIICQNLRKLVLLTCWHLFDFEDTLRTFYLDENRRLTPFLHSLSIKRGQNIFIYHPSGRSSLGEIIAIDREDDLALIETATEEILLSESPFEGPFGDAERVKLGQEIYLLGFPGGYFMVTRGLVSPSSLKNEFMVDAPFNSGFSGGVAIVFTPDGGYELVGLANAVAYNPQTVLVPIQEPNIGERYGDLPYDGEIYIKDMKLISYGLTFVIKSNVIIDFLQRERDKLRGLGYVLPGGIRE